METSSDGLERERPRIVEGYKAFKALTPQEVGKGNIVVTGISPSKLWASQDWVSQDKVARASRGPQAGTEETRFLEAYYRDMETGQRAMILANGHHHALRASEQGQKVGLRIIGSLPAGKEFLSFSKYRRQAGTPFRE